VNTSAQGIVHAKTGQSSLPLCCHSRACAFILIQFSGTMTGVNSLSGARLS
jgi:hypothetical protein